jgi:hypothetical protein
LASFAVRPASTFAKKKPMHAKQIPFLLALAGLAQWFFGNLYEQIVLVPNSLVSSYAQHRCWQAYFVVTNPIYYYVPFTQLAVCLVWYLCFTQKHPEIKKLLYRASLYGLLALALTAVIVTQLNLKVFFGNLDLIKDQLYQLSLIWMIANGVRLVLVGATLGYTFKSYLLAHGQTR